MSDVAFGPCQLFHCEAFPDQFLQIVYSQNMLLHLPLKIETVTKSEQQHAEIIAYNFKPDCKIFNELGMSYNNLFIWGFTSLSTLYRSYHDG